MTELEQTMTVEEWKYWLALLTIVEPAEEKEREEKAKQAQATARARGRR